MEVFRFHEGILSFSCVLWKMRKQSQYPVLVNLLQILYLRIVINGHSAIDRIKLLSLTTTEYS